MPTFSYTARKRTGEKIDGSLNAADRRTAMLQLNRLGMVPISVKEGNGASVPAPAVSTSKKSNGTKKPAQTKKKAISTKSLGKKFQFESQGKKKMKLRETMLFTREMADLIASGMTLGNGLDSLARRNSDNVQGEITQLLRDDIIQGASFSEALAKHPESFPPFYISMVTAGEASGQLSESLISLVAYYERMIEAKEKVTMALVYPAIVLVIGVGSVVFCMIYVIPKFTQIFNDVGIALPLSTRILMSMSGGMIKYGWLITLMFFLGSIMFRAWKKTEAGRYAWDGIKLKMPVIKGIINANAFSNFARTLGGLLKNGVPVLKALQISEDTVGNEVIASQVRDARQRVTDGSSISKPLSQGQVFPQLFTDMLGVGEDSGNVSGSLHHIAERYDEDLNRSIKVFTTVLEPILMLFMALAVGFVALSMLSAVFSMTNGLGQ